MNGQQRDHEDSVVICEGDLHRKRERTVDIIAGRSLNLSLIESLEEAPIFYL